MAAGSGPQQVVTVASPNNRERFLGEFDGPVIVGAPPYDPQHFVTVEESITLTLRDLKPHTFVTVAFDLYVLKSWDGNNRTYGPTAGVCAFRTGRRFSIPRSPIIRRPAPI